MQQTKSSPFFRNFPHAAYVQIIFTSIGVAIILWVAKGQKMKYIRGFLAPTYFKCLHARSNAERPVGTVNDVHGETWPLLEED